MRQLRRLTIHRALMRPILLAGGERKLVMLNFTLIAALLMGAGLNTLSILTAILLGTLGHMGLVRLAKYDPQFLTIYLRYRQYRDWYSAQSNQFNQAHPVKCAISRGIRP